MYKQDILKMLETENIGKIVDVNKRTIICRQGQEESNYLYYILSGLAFTYKTNENGQTCIIRLVKEKRFYGMAYLFRNSPYRVSLESLIPTRLIKIPKTAFENLLMQKPELLVPLFIELSDRLFQTGDLVIDKYLTAEERIKKSLKFIGDELGSQTGDGRVINIHLTHEDLAAFSSTTRVTVTKVLARLVKQKLLDTTRQPWVIYF